MYSKKILLIDEDSLFQKKTRQLFENAGAKVISTCDAMEGINNVLTQKPNLIILDIKISGNGGIQLCKTIRQFSNTPLIMVSALEKDQLWLDSLAAGADDFIIKPVNPEILLARAMAVMRRSENSNGFHTLVDYDDGFLKINIEKHRVFLKNKRVKLTPLEFRLLAYLVTNADRVLSFEQILDNVWGIEYKGNDEFVHVYISHLRSKIEMDTKSPRYILSVHGVGYMFEKHVSAHAPSL